MRNNRTKVFVGAMASVSLASLAAPAFAAADAPADAAAAAQTDAPADDSQIVVTGSLIRGVAAVGSETIAFNADAIAAKAATSTNELLSAIPQISNAFNGRFDGDPRIVATGVSINKPNLRNLPSTNSTSGATTLVLLNGMRLTPVGVNQAAVDVDIIPAAVLEGVDVVPDGGSSLYGADAVAGVLNFRTLKKFDGVKIDGNLGLGTTIKGFHQWDGALTAGKSWSSGNAYISVGHSERDGIANGQVKWSSGLVYKADGTSAYNYTQCASPVGTQIKYFFYGAGWTNNPAAPGAGTFPIGTACDATSAQSYLPSQKRSNVFGSLSQQVADNIDLKVTAYWTKRQTELTNYPRGYTTPAQTPVFPTGVGIGTIYTVLGGTGFSFAPNAAYVNTPTRIGFETWGITPELTFKLGHNWQLKSSVFLGRSTNYQRFPDVNTVTAQAYVNSGALNPLNVAAASASVITDVTNYENAQDTTQQLFTFRSVADGPIFALPGGDAKLAVGIEYQDNGANSRLNAGAIGSIGAVPYMKAVRNAKSAFAEVSLPLSSIVDVSASVRYDNYSDFGNSTNPSIGLTIKPTSWFKIYAHGDSSFNAPTALDDLGIATGRYVCGIYTAGSTDPTKRPTDPLGRDTSKQGSCAMVLQGSSPGLKPQTARTWAVGFELNPVHALRLGGEFYSINFMNVLGTLNPGNLNTYVTNPNLYTYNISASTFSNVLGQLTNGAALGAQHPNTDIAIIVDTRTTNLNSAKLEGVDFHLAYDTDASFGHIAFSLSGTETTRNFQTTGGVATNELGHGSARLSASTSLGWSHGPLSARATVNYTGKYHDIATDNLGAVEDVNPFVVTNLNFGYDFKGSTGALSGTSLRLTIDNVFDVSPQTILRTNTSFLSYNNFTLGRVIKLGFSEKF